MGTAPQSPARPADPTEMVPRHLVICCDGTGNQASGDLSNVLKLFRIARKDSRQRVYYDPGVGTIGNQNAWGRLTQDARAVFGLATGAGLDDNILDAYRFLVQNYEGEDDRIFLFGFSRGAYTVRALAGFIEMIGLLPPDQLNICDYALTAYKQASEKNDFHLAWDFARTTGARRATIHFMGVWDTVASMIVPRPDRFYLPSLRTLPYTRENPGVRAFRHAMAIDERRRMFRLNRWVEPQDFVPDRFDKDVEPQPQDIVQMWFPGVHSDVGGGYPEVESGLSKYPLVWMIDEAASEKHGLRISRSMYRHLARGEPLPGGKRFYVPPDPCAKMHESLKHVWWLLEWLPKSMRWREWRRGALGWYLPRGEPRRIEPGALIHESAQLRGGCTPAYAPPNLPPSPPLPPEGRWGPRLRALTGVPLLLALAAGAAWLIWRWWWAAAPTLAGLAAAAGLALALAVIVLAGAAAAGLIGGTRGASGRGRP